MLAFKIAVRFLAHGRTQTILIVIGIAIAISIQVFVGLLIDSLQRTLVDRTIGNSPHITISSATDVSTIRDWEKMPVLVRGFPFSAADSIYDIGNAIYDGREYSSSGEVLLGRELREELELDIGDKIVVSIPDRGSVTLTISGFYDLGVASINKSWLFTTGLWDDVDFWRDSGDWNTA